MIFTPKTTFNLLSSDVNATDLTGDEIDAQTFTSIIYKRSRLRDEHETNGFWASDGYAEIDAYFTEQIDTCSDANAFTLLMMPYAKWHDAMLHLGYNIQPTY